MMQHEQHRPAQISDDGMVEAGDAQCRQQQRKHDHERDRKADAGNGAEREQERDQVEPNEAALLLFVVDDVERVEDRLHPGIGAPQCDAESQQEPEGEPAVALGRDAGDLGRYDLEAAGRDDIGRDLKVIADGGRVGEQGIGRHPCRDGGNQGDQRIECHPGGERQQAVVLDLPIGAEKNILPAGPGDLQRGARPAAAAGLGGPPFLQGQRLLRRGCARRRCRRTGPAPIVPRPERIDHACRHEHRGGEPGNETFEPVRVGHALSPAAGGRESVNNDRPPVRFHATEFRG